MSPGDATKPGDLRTQYDGPRPDPKIAGTCGKSGTYQVGHRASPVKAIPAAVIEFTFARAVPLNFVCAARTPEQPMRKKGAIILATGGP